MASTLPPVRLVPMRREPGPAGAGPAHGAEIHPAEPVEAHPLGLEQSLLLGCPAAALALADAALAVDDPVPGHVATGGTAAMA